MEQTDYRPEQRARVQRFKEENIKQPCRVYGCREKREGLSQYCRLHADRVGLYGSPTFRPIDQLTGISSLSKDLAEQIKAKRLPDLENKLLATMARWLPRDPAYIYRNMEVEAGIKRIEKARICLATATHKAGPERVLAFSILWAAAMELDKAAHANKVQWREYYRAHLGQDVATLAGIGRTWTEIKRTYRVDNWHYVGQAPQRRTVAEERVRIRKMQTIKGAVKRRAGQLLLDQLHSQLGHTHNWLNDPWLASYAGRLRERLSSVPFNQREFPV